MGQNLIVLKDKGLKGNGYFKALILIMNKTTKQKIDKEIEDMKYTIN